MLKVRSSLDLSEEAISADHGSKLRSQDFHRDLSIVLDILREIDCRHSSCAQLALDTISVS
jgi:hypothetical protein